MINTVPSADEYTEYQSTYVRLVPDGDILAILREQLADTRALMSSLTDSQAEFRYAEGKWSLKEVVAHIADNERIMAYRLLAVARGDQTSLPGYDQDEYIATVDLASVPLAVLVEDFAAVRIATLSMLGLLSEAAWQRRGTANGTTISVRALAYIIAGHERYHLNILKEKYLI
ncbi:DinB family protein [Paenibacillus sp. NPDC058071]|uniref:DinB family protein n=1 Tax=Paenibacillus sp. NPDC058071 TaxID=3346326 RepID=UPI0036DED4E3